MPHEGCAAPSKRTRTLSTDYSIPQQRQQTRSRYSADAMAGKARTGSGGSRGGGGGDVGGDGHAGSSQRSSRVVQTLDLDEALAAQRPDRAQQKASLDEALRDNVAPHGSIVQDTSVAHYLVPKQWWSQYVEFLHNGSEEPGRLDIPDGIDHLLDNGEIRSEDDFVILTVEAWTLIQEWYGFEGEELLRYPIQIAGEWQLDLRPTEFHFSMYDAQTRLFSPLKTVSMYRRKKMDDLYLKVASCFQLPQDTPIRLWHVRTSGRLGTLEDLSGSISKTFDEISIAALVGKETTFIVERRENSKQKWPLDEAVQTKAPKPVVRSRRGTKGLINMGNTCYMASALQCLSHVKELVMYCLSGAWRTELNTDNPLGYGGRVASAFAKLILLLNEEDGQRSVRPAELKATLGSINQSFGGYQQQDSQELLAFLLDALHEDLNRIIRKPATTRPDIGDVSEDELLDLGRQAWDIHKQRNDSVIVDLFQGVYKSTLVCPVCSHVSITFDPFSDLSLPLPFRTYWSHDITYIPIDGRPVRLWLEFEQNASIAHIISYLSKRFAVPTDRIAGAEVWKARVYKWYENYMPVTTIEKADVAYFYELEHADPRQDKKPAGYLVPIYTFRASKYGSGVEEQDHPFLIVFNQQEAQSYERIQQKVLQYYSKYTTSTDLNLHNIPVAGKEEQQDSDDSDSDKPSIRAERLRKARNDQPLTIKVGQAKNESFYNGTKAVPLRDRASPAGPPVLPPRHVTTPPVDDLPSYDDIDSQAEPDDRAVSDVSTRHTTPDIQMKDDSDTASVANDDLVDKLEPVSPSPAVSDVMSDTEDGESTAAPVIAQQPLLRHGEALYCEWSSSAYEQLFSREADTLAGQSRWEDVEQQTDDVMEARRSERENAHEKTKSLEDCLDEFAKEEPLDAANAWYCPKCKTHQQANKTFELWRAGDILVFHLKRFSNSRSLSDKIDAEIRFPVRGLDLSDRLGERKLRAKKGDTDLPAAVYDLMGVVNHYGGLGGGHYTAFAQNFYDDTFHNFNDANVNAMDAEALVSSSAYLLFYRRRSEQPLGGALQERVQAAWTEEAGGARSGASHAPPSAVVGPQVSFALMNRERSESAGPAGSPGSSPTTSVNNLAFEPSLRIEPFGRALGGPGGYTTGAASGTSGTIYPPPASNPFSEGAGWMSNAANRTAPTSQLALQQVPLDDPDESSGPVINVNPDSDSDWNQED